MGWVLGGFQYQVAQQLMGRLPRRRTDEKWEYTLASEAREESGFEVMEEYSWRRQKTVAQFIDTQSILDLCEETERTPGARVGVWWWEQAVFDLAGARETTESAEEADGDGMAKRQEKKRKTTGLGHQ